jgi:hypothetical protein
MNNHLNLFRFFNESAEKEFIENNLSRAFALCLANNSFFLNEYVRKIVSPDDYQYLFSSINSDTKCVVDIQIDTATLEMEGYKTLYAVAMTTDFSLNMDDFFKQPEFSDKKNITDILITIKDVGIIVEVKRSGVDCKAQLFNQACPFIKSQIEVKPKPCSWQDVVKLLERVKNVQQLVSQHCPFTNDFLELSEIRYPEWFEPKPFNVIHFSEIEGTPNHNQLMKRMRQALAGVSAKVGEDYQLLPYNDRLGISVPFGWASEVIPYFTSYDDKIKNYVEFYIWPGNTKQQGSLIFNKPLDWTKTQNLTISGKKYSIDVNRHVKLSHFLGRYVSGLIYSDADLLKPLHTAENYYQQSGKWEESQWKNFEKLMDEHFKTEFDWRKKCDWEINFTKTDRTYFTMSLGYEVCLYIPFADFKALDKTEADIKKVSSFIASIVEAFKNLIP